jgi:hypothetical protein
MNVTQITATNYSHPTITTGQHTNGPAIVWIQVDGEWYDTECQYRHKVRAWLEAHGPERIMDRTWMLLRDK